MNFNEQEQLSSLLKGALLSESENEALANLRALTRKIKSLDIDLHDIRIFDQSAGSSVSVAADAIREKQALNKAMIHMMEKYKERMARLDSFQQQSKRRNSKPTNNLVHTKRWINKVIRESGPDGISRQDLRNLDENNKSMTRRMGDLLWADGTVFTVGENLVHTDFSTNHPVEAARHQTARRIHIEEGPQSRDAYLRDNT